ncbi:MAG: DUF4337 family protein [Alphaproteobacteria bacterium]|nr:DUF4337 family protein [Alphaproteobacteria bacterium]
MSDNVPLRAHEHREHAEHAAETQDMFISLVSITIAILAVIASLAGSLEMIEVSQVITLSSNSVLRQNQATDAWSEYQANSIKKHVYAAAASIAPGSSSSLGALSQRQASKQAKIRQRALMAEAERDHLARESERHEIRHVWLAAAATLAEIAIAISTVAIVTRRRSFWKAAMGLGVISFVLLVGAYLV